VETHHIGTCLFERRALRFPEDRYRHWLKRHVSLKPEFVEERCQPGTPRRTSIGIGCCDGVGQKINGDWPSCLLAQRRDRLGDGIRRQQGRGKRSEATGIADCNHHFFRDISSHRRLDDRPSHTELREK
jgi:hypothetical protein